MSVASTTHRTKEPASRRVEHVDTDASGVVHFSRWAVFMETAILDHLESLGAGLEALSSRGLDLRVANLNIRYLASARYRDCLHLFPEIREDTPASLQIRCSIWSANAGDTRRRLAEGEILLACVGKADGQLLEIPDDLLAMLKEAQT